MDKIRVGIIGGAGYTGGELLRLLLFHPDVSINFVHSSSQTGKKISDVFPDLTGDTDMVFTNKVGEDADVVFLCSGHGRAKELLAKTVFGGNTRIIDLSQDFRILSDDTSHFTYGLPELHKARIVRAKHIANPGCFATAIQLALLPLAAKQLLVSDIHISATTGSTGAGQSLNETSHFSWRNNNLSVYKAFTHQHLAEIRQGLAQLQPGYGHNIFMVPQRGAFSRGILACLIMTCTLAVEEIRNLFEQFYESHPFTHVSLQNVDIKQVVNTNKCLIYLEKHDDQLMIVSVIDNLLKGASGQALQNMNLLFGLEETRGLRLKASVF